MLLFAADAGNQQKDAISSTLSWVCRKKNQQLEIYYDACRAGIHYGGDEAEGGSELYGSTVVGGRHFEHFLYLKSNFDLSIALSDRSILESVLTNTRTITRSGRLSEFYKDIFSFYDLDFPSIGVMTGNSSLKLGAYCFPEIHFRNALGLDETTPDYELDNLVQIGLNRVFALYIKDKTIEKLRQKGIEVEILDSLSPNDTYASITSRMAKRWLSKETGFFLGGPVLVSYWLPWCSRNGYLPIYGVPHTSVIGMLEKEIAESNYTVYGRQFADEDFLVLSKLNKCFQLVDPSRPVFPVAANISNSNRLKDVTNSFDEEVSDKKLSEYASDNRVLASLLFWSGDLRSIETLYGILDLAATTGIKAGVVISAQWYQHIMKPYLQMLKEPLEKGGVYPNLEPLLGSSGLGVSFEAYNSPETLSNNLSKSMKMISNSVGKDSLPHGWFPIMDSPLVKKKVPTFSLNRLGYSNSFPFLIRRKRPFDSYQPGKFNKPLFEGVKRAGFKYAFTKSAFGSSHSFCLDDFVVLNLTAGKWEGWSPFIAVTSLDDLISSENKLLSIDKPGWLIGVIDACCWTFTKHMLAKGAELERISNFLSKGGYSGKLINTVPRTIARYAKIISKEEMRK